MTNNLFNFSISDYVNENKMNIFNNSPFSDTDWFLYNKEDSNVILEPYEDPNQGIAFKDVNNIMNPEFISDMIEKEEEQDIYFLKEEEKNDSTFLGKKRNNDSNLKENQEIKENIDQKETKPSTGELSQSKKIKKILFNSDQNKDSKQKEYSNSKNKIYRNDYYIKKFKVECFSNYAKDKLNDLLTACDFPKELNLKKIYMPNNKAFTSIANLKENKKFLDKEIKVIFSMEKGNGQNQKKNAENFATIFNSRNEAGNIQAYENLINFLNKTVEDVIRDFYHSDEFEKFKLDEEIQKYDDAFYQEKKFRILQDFGFLTLIKGDY